MRKKKEKQKQNDRCSPHYSIETKSMLAHLADILVIHTHFFFRLKKIFFNISSKEKALHKTNTCVATINLSNHNILLYLL